MSLKVRTYNPSDFEEITNDATGLSFGTVVQGSHNASPIVLQPYGDGITPSRIALFLEDRGSFVHCAFGKFQSATQIKGVPAGDTRLSDDFTVRPDVSDFTLVSDGLDIGGSAGNWNYVWLDVQAGGNSLGTQDPASENVNYRFVFEYND